MDHQPEKFPASTKNERLGSGHQAEAEEFLRQYLSIVKRIFETVRIEKPEILTELRRRANVRKRNAKNALI